MNEAHEAAAAALAAVEGKNIKDKHTDKTPNSNKDANGKNKDGAKADDTTKPPKKSYDEKNIRRRVYDALNVLMAMDIITKDKKQITWRGLPGSRRNPYPYDVHDPYNPNCSHNPLNGHGGQDPNGANSNSPHGHSNYQAEDDSDSLDDGLGDNNGRPSHPRHHPNSHIHQLQQDKTKLQTSLSKKREALQELMVQNVCFRNLLGRNHAREVQASTSSGQHQHHPQYSQH